jgi:cytochrome c oxidase subunit 4
MTTTSDTVAASGDQAPRLHQEHDHADDHGSHVSDLFYIKVALALAVITGVEVAISYIHIGPLFLPLLLALMVVKFFTVVLVFMHIKYDAKIFGRLFYIGLFLAVFVYSATLLTFHFFSG